MQSSFTPPIEPADRTRARVRLGYKLTQLAVRSVFRVLFGLKRVGCENVPISGPFILAVNHQSWFDPPIVGSSCPRELHYAAKAELFKNPLLGPLVRYYNSVPVQRSGYDRRVLNLLGQALESGEAVVIFPEGTRFLDGRLRKPKSGVGMLALHYEAPIVPAYVSGSARIHRQFWKRGLTVTFGAPFTLETIGLSGLQGREGYKSVASAVMAQIAAVGNVTAP